MSSDSMNAARAKHNQKIKRYGVTFYKEKELPLLLKNCKKAGFKVEDVNKYMKDIALNGKIIIKKAPVKEMEDAKKILFQLRKWGSNFNQLTRIANTRRTDPLHENILNEIKTAKEYISKVERLYKL